MPRARLQPNRRGLYVTIAGDTPYHFAWLVLNDEDFSREMAPLVTTDDFPQGALRGLTMLAKDQAERFGRTTTKQTLTAAIEAGFPAEKYGTDADSMADVFDRLSAFEPDDASYGRIEETARAWLKHRHMRKAADEASAALDRGDVELAAESLDLLHQAHTPIEPPLSLGDIGRLYEESDNGAIPTGIHFIDEAWEGGIHAHQFGVLIAVTNIGKSQTLCYLACSAYRANYSILFYTSELAPKQILGRIVSGLIERSYDQVDELEVMQQLVDYRAEHGITASIWVKAISEGMTTASLRLDLEQMARDGKQVDMVLLDSADDMAPTTKAKDDWLRLESIYSGLRLLAVRTGMPIWTSTQAKQEAVEKARISLKHIGRSWAKAQRAHFVVGLAQTEQQRADPLGPIVGVYIIKDSEYGSISQWAEMQATFGQGKGYPGFKALH